MRYGRRLPWARFAVVAALIALDLWSKQAVFAWFEAGPEGLVRDGHGHSRVPVLGSWLAFMTSLNPGAAFGKGGDLQQFLVIGRVAAVGLLAWLLWRAERSRPVLLTALVLVLAGALGNLYDNLFMDVEGDAHPFGLVRDFIDVYFTRWDYHFPTFNVADSAISVGAVLLLLSGFGPQPAADAAAGDEVRPTAAATDLQTDAAASPSQPDVSEGGAGASDPGPGTPTETPPSVGSPGDHPVPAGPSKD